MTPEDFTWDVANWRVMAALYAIGFVLCGIVVWLVGDRLVMSIFAVAAIAGIVIVACKYGLTKNDA